MEIGNKAISKARQIWYMLTEPILLNIARYRHEWDYKYNFYVFPPFVSIYTPTYNRGSLLMERALKSVMNQTYTNWEYIIVGDGCTDNTEELVKSINDPRIRYFNIHKKKTYPMTAQNQWFAGPVNAANYALSKVNGKWIARIDDDDTWTEDHLEKLLTFAYTWDYEFVSSAYIAKRNGKETKIDAINEVPRIGGTQTWLYRSYLKFMKYNPDCWRKEWNKVNDTDLAERFGKLGLRIGYLQDVTAYVIPRPNEDTIGYEAALKYDIIRDPKY